jgi:hypothetical protein
MKYNAKNILEKIKIFYYKLKECWFILKQPYEEENQPEEPDVIDWLEVIDNHIDCARHHTMQAKQKNRSARKLT